MLYNYILIYNNSSVSARSILIMNHVCILSQITQNIAKNNVAIVPKSNQINKTPKPSTIQFIHLLVIYNHTDFYTCTLYSMFITVIVYCMHVA